MKLLTWGDRFATVMLLIVLTFSLAMTGALSRVDNVIYDMAQQFLGRDIPSDVVMVTIDEQSLATLGRWPWSRRLHAQLIDRLHADGASVIGIDIMFSEPQADDPGADQVLAQSMADSGRVVLPVILEKVRNNGQLVETLPLSQLTAQAVALGRTHAELDADAIARSIVLWEGVDKPVWPHFVQAVLTVTAQLPEQLSAQAPFFPVQSKGFIVKHDQRYVRFASATQRIPSLSFSQVMRGEFSPGTFDHKMVLVGASASGLSDSLPTPVSGFQQPMPGVEFLANALISMRAQTLISRASVWFSALLACGLAVLPMLWLPYVRPRFGLVMNIGFALFVMLVAMALPYLLKFWVPLSAALFGVFSSYPLWAWRKLESASLFLDEELRRLQSALSMVHVNKQATKRDVDVHYSEHFQRRIAQVRSVTAQLQEIEQAQKEILAFVSHDIRVPLAIAAAQIKQDLGEQYPAHKQVVRALAWTEEFLQIKRVQLLHPKVFTELDAVALLHEAADDIYPLLKTRSLVLDLPDDPVWVRGNFDTLLRTFGNLLSNALHFSTQEGQIKLSAQVRGRQLCIAVSNQGPEIAEQDIPKLFKRFGRLSKDNSSTQSGAGLGLYFVKATMHKHAGAVYVKSQEGWTTFELHFPLSDEP